MLQAAAMMLGLTLLWLVLAPASPNPQQLALSAGVALVCVALSWRFGGFSRAPAPFGLIVLRARRAPEVLRGAFKTIRAAIAADVSLEPALVRIKPRPTSDAARAGLAHALGLAPGMIVVESDSEGLLAHVTHENDTDAHHISAIEDKILTAFNARRG